MRLMAYSVMRPVPLTIGNDSQHLPLHPVMFCFAASMRI